MTSCRIFLLVTLVVAITFPALSSRAAGSSPAEQSSVKGVAAAAVEPSSVEPSSVERSAADWLRLARQSLSTDEREVAEVEIVADYRYLDGTGQRLLRDETRIGRENLWQKRDLAGGPVERYSGTDGAWIRTSDDKQELEGALRQELQAYHCLRQLQLGVSCGGLDMEVETGTVGKRVWLRFERDRALFARLGLDRESGRPLLMQYPESIISGEADSTAVMITTVFASYREVDGWQLPHYVESFRESTPTSIYSVVSAGVRYQAEPSQAP